MKRLRIITKASRHGIISSDVYEGWFKGDRFSSENLPYDKRRDLNYAISRAEERFEKYRKNHPLIDIERDYYIKI